MNAYIMKSGVLMTMAAAAVLTTGGSANAQGYAHIDRVAAQIERQARILHREVDEHARRSPQYAHLHRDVEEAERLAAHIHEVAHRGGSLAHIRADARKLDRLVHHIEEVVDDLAHSRGGRGGLGHIRCELDRLSRLVHHLMDDLR